MSDPLKRDPHSRRARAALMVAVLLSLAGFSAGWIVAKENGDQRDAIARPSQELVDCVKGPQVDCQAEADEVEKTIDEEVAPSAVVTGPAGDAGDDGRDGDDGQDGEDGEDGSDGADSIVRGSSCVEQLGLQRCRGPRGETGQDGAVSTVPGPEGRPGEPGQDSTVPGPPGPVGPAGPKGDTGADGAPGQDGNPGTANPGTYTCPDGQTMHGFTVTETGDVTLDCRDQLLAP